MDTLSEDELARLIHAYELTKRPVLGCGWKFDSTRAPWAEDGSTRVAWEGEPPEQVPLCPCRTWARRMLAAMAEGRDEHILPSGRLRGWNGGDPE